MSTELWAALGGIGIAIVTIVGAFLRGASAGRAAEQRAALEAAVRGARERSDADVAAARAADPIGELRDRGWVRGVAPDHGGRDGQRGHGPTGLSP
jgi:hypothetical protein